MTKRSVAIILVYIIALLDFSRHEGGTFTSGFPSLVEIQGNGSLLNDSAYSTHDGEERSVPGIQFTCNGRITKISFIALPGVGSMNSVFRVIRSDGIVRSNSGTSAATQSFGDFGYELSGLVAPFQNGDTLQIVHESSHLRILHQVGDKELDVCWRLWRVNGNYSCGPDYDYPLLAVETDPPGCVEGSLSVSELRTKWENRTRPVLYSSPDRDITLDCSGPGSLSEILVGAYVTGTGDKGPRITINGTDVCDLSTLHATEHLNVYSCVPDSEVEIGVGSTLHVAQRNATSLISFLHDGQTDTPLMSVTISGECSSSGLFSKDDLREKAALNIPNFAVVEDALIVFEHLNITQDGYLTKWIFTAEDLGEGDGRTQYPDLSIIRHYMANIQTVITLPGSDAVLTDYPNVYEYTLQNPTQVLSGDVISIMLPPISNARLLLSFVQNGGPYGVNLQRKKDVDPVSGREGPLPLVTMEILPLPSTPVPSPQSSPQPTQNQNPTTCLPNQDDVDYWKIIAICSLVALSIVTVAVTLCCILFWLRKRKGNPKSVNKVTYHSQNESVRVDSNPASYSQW